MIHLEKKQRKKEIEKGRRDNRETVRGKKRKMKERIKQIMEKLSLFKNSVTTDTGKPK